MAAATAAEVVVIITNMVGARLGIRGRRLREDEAHHTIEALLLDGTLIHMSLLVEEGVDQTTGDVGLSLREDQAHTLAHLREPHHHLEGIETLHLLDLVEGDIALADPQLHRAVDTAETGIGGVQGGVMTEQDP